MKTMSYEEMREFVDRFTWIFAKTYAEKCPHEYIVKTKIDPAHWKVFENFVATIRSIGFEAAYNHRIGRYYILGEYYYWTMGAPISETIILNRGKVSDYQLVDNTWILRENKEL
ncbi:hypothetical protein [Acetobacterium sp.]|uniref:hypothetical protein n=1 Tax=Acetobacterium sp. TaxID=1872094 RepID=UPI002F403A48